MENWGKQALEVNAGEHVHARSGEEVAHSVNRGVIRDNKVVAKPIEGYEKRAVEDWRW